ncbi:MAG: glycosyltransferase family 2 protein [Candidatus Gastranaerophilaceae bacterium]
MTVDSKLLSICIPTYNGDKYIEKNIDTIIKQIKEYCLKDVEIVVSDNCSTDRIPEIMQNYLKMYPNIIRYSRNEQNLGYDGNVMKCCEIANGKFIHLFGDDDYYAPCGLKRLHDVLIEKPEISVCILSNYYHRNDFYNVIVSRKGLQKIFYTNDKYYTNDADNFIIDLEDRAWPNTNLVFRKEYYEQIPNLEQFFKKDWIHFYILLYLSIHWQYCYLFADKYPIVINRVGVQKWLNNVDGPRIYFNNLWIYSFANKLGYSKKVFEWYRKKLLDEYIKNIEYRRSKNLFENIKYVGKYFPYYKDYINFYFKFVPCLLNFHKSIFNVINHRLSNGRIKEKVCVFMGYEFRLKLQRINRNIIFLHKLIPNEYLELSNTKGNFKQFVKGNVYKEINDLLSKTSPQLKNKILFKNAMKYRHKKNLIPYHIYIADNYIINKLFKKEINELRQANDFSNI